MSLATAQPGFPPCWKSLMDIKWVPGGGPSAIQATAIHICGDWSLILSHVYKMLLLKLISMVKRLLQHFLLNQSSLFIILTGINWETMPLLGRESSPAKACLLRWSPWIQYSRPGPKEAQVAPTGLGLCPGGTPPSADLSAWQWPSADTGAARSLPWQWW